jgi:hypothetical protein
MTNITFALLVFILPHAPTPMLVVFVLELREHNLIL